MTPERSSIQFGLTPIPYMIRRSARRQTVTIAVDPSEGVLLFAPTAATVERLDKLVHKKAPWIVTQMRALDRDGTSTPREFVSGETFLYLGRQYRLRLLRAVEGVSLQGGWLRVATNSPEQVRRELVRWYRDHALERLCDRVDEWAKKLRVEVPPVLVRDQRKRWGSCDARGHLRFNWRVIQAPRRLVDYVVVHELVHLEHRTHSKKFWRALQRAMPNFESRREALRILGSRLDW